VNKDEFRWVEQAPQRMRNPFAPEPWASRSKWLAPRLSFDAAQLESFARAHHAGDGLADELARWLAAEPRGHRDFERALTLGIDALHAPAPELRAFFDDVERVPAWLDREKIALAGALYHRTYVGSLHVLFALGLLTGYLSSGVARVLASTGGLERMAPRRLAETDKFVTDVYGPGQLTRSSAGYETTVRVRLMHAMVRHKLLARNWDTRAWGVPINQADMAGTTLQFSITYLLGLRALGFHVSAAEADAVLHTWRYVGRLSGVDEALLPRTEGEARGQLRLSFASQAGPSDESRALARALLSAPATMVGDAARPWVERVMRSRAGFARLVMGDEAADALGLPDELAFKLAPLATFPVVYGAEWLRRLTPFATRGLCSLGASLAGRMSSALLAGKAPSYVPHELAA
jgi:ER-bound oxygenase mpaB/B'/Rubber oxygenase, catalytic domain